MNLMLTNMLIFLFIDTLDLDSKTARWTFIARPGRYVGRQGFFFFFLIRYGTVSFGVPAVALPMVIGIEEAVRLGVVVTCAANGSSNVARWIIPFAKSLQKCAIRS